MRLLIEINLALTTLGGRNFNPTTFGVRTFPGTVIMN
jgi:hypothetical protein